jgi:hypothetical protein
MKGGFMSRTILKLIAIIVIATVHAFSFSGAGAGTIGFYRFESGPAGPTGMTIVIHQETITTNNLRWITKLFAASEVIE